MHCLSLFQCLQYHLGKKLGQKYKGFSCSPSIIHGVWFHLFTWLYLGGALQQRNQMMPFTESPTNSYIEDVEGDSNTWPHSKYSTSGPFASTAAKTIV